MTWSIIIQARASSTRLPGKIFKEVGGLSLLEFQIERLRQIPSRPKLIIATTTNRADDKTLALATKMNLSCFRGSEDNVLSRYMEAAQAFEADPIGRVTSDCPLIDPDIIESVYQLFLSSKADYVSNTIMRRFPRGLDIEIFSLAALQRAYREALDVSDREHVTPYIRHHADFFRLENFECSEDYSAHRWTVDTAEDFDLIEKLILSLKTNPRFRMNHVLDILKQNPEWQKINAHIEQKKV